MSRIPLTDIDQQPEPIREFVARQGDLNVFRLLANAPEVFAGWAQMVDELSDSPTFGPQKRELIVLRVAHLQGSRYELGQHTDVARAAGLTEQQIQAIIDTGDLDAAGFGPTERIALDVVTELCITRQLRDDSFAAAHAAFGDEALTELLMIVSCYNGLALVVNADELDLDTTARFQPRTGAQA
jgi:4-carboxymuconolactone decarboxylase